MPRFCSATVMVCTCANRRALAPPGRCGIDSAGAIAANDLLRFARRIFAFGVGRHVVPINPIVDFSPRLDAGGPEKSRSRALSHEELIKLFAVKLLLALCVRKSELLGVRWAEFDIEGDLRSGAIWHLAGSRLSTAPPHLPASALPH
ncbi:MAG TPA: hypothetical protein VGG26_00020 [Terracidiphilus sp.]|jgi:integrase